VPFCVLPGDGEPGLAAGNAAMTTAAVKR